jgi:hypothetical protein
MMDEKLVVVGFGSMAHLVESFLYFRIKLDNVGDYYLTDGESLELLSDVSDRFRSAISTLKDAGKIKPTTIKSMTNSWMPAEEFQQLFNGDPVEYAKVFYYPNRPREDDAEIIKSVAERLLPQLKAWHDEDDGGETLDEMFSLLKRSTDWDGYALAKDMEGAGYSPDADLVDLLSNAEHYRYSVLGSKVREWVIANKIESKLKVGDMVKFSSIRSTKAFPIRKKGEQGEIVEVMADRACYVIRNEKVTSPKSKRGGYVIAFEDVEPTTVSQSVATV